MKAVVTYTTISGFFKGTEVEILEKGFHHSIVSFKGREKRIKNDYLRFYE